jgi:hypothetical protein
VFERSIFCETAVLWTKFSKGSVFFEGCATIVPQDLGSAAQDPGEAEDLGSAAQDPGEAEDLGSGPTGPEAPGDLGSEAPDQV